jgi:hypothetical protein
MQPLGEYDVSPGSSWALPDGSPHDWLQGRGPPLCLIGAIDDATGKVMGAFFTQAEALGSSLELMDTSDNLFDPISELLFSGHLGFYRTATPTHCRIMTHSEVLRHLG